MCVCVGGGCALTPKQPRRALLIELQTLNGPREGSSANMSAPSSDTRKRGKKRYAGGGQGKRWKGSRELEVGMKGILITCNMNERKCTAEAFNLLNEYADELFGPEKVSSGALSRPRPLFLFPVTDEACFNEINNRN